MRLRKLRLTNRRARLGVGVLLAGLCLVLCTQTDAVHISTLVRPLDGMVLGSNSPDVTATVMALARTDHTALLRYCLGAYDERYQNYTCTLIKQERIGETLGEEQWIAVKFSESPYSVAMNWSKNAPMADRILYVEGKYGGKMLARPTNRLLRALVPGGTVCRAPDGPDARKSTLRPVSMFGFKRILVSLIDVYAQAKQAGDLEESFGGVKDVAGRQALVLVRVLPARKDYPAHKTITYIDLEYLVPIGVEGYDWDGRLVCRYFYKGIAFNMPLTGEDFLPKANGLAAPS